MYKVKVQFCCWLFLINISATNPVVNAPFFDSRDNTVQMTEASKPLGVMCSGKAESSCKNISGEHQCLRETVTGTFILISCHPSPWQDAVKYCESKKSHLVQKDVPQGDLQIQEAARKLSDCRKFWLNQKVITTKQSTRSGLFGRYFNLTTIQLKIHLSTDEPLISSTISTLNTTTTTRNALAIYLSVGLVIPVIIIIIIVTVCIKRRKKHKKKNHSHKNGSSRLESVPLIKRLVIRNKVKEECVSSVLQELCKSAKNPEFKDINKRIKSFKTWENKNVEPVTLAHAGFFYEGKGDKVKCFLCDGGLEKWEKSDLPWYLHYKTFPDCLYVRACENQPYIRKIIQQGKIQNEGPNGENIDQQLCMQCYKNKASSVFLPCNHVCCCYDCGSKITECPECDETVKGVLQVKIKEDEVKGVLQVKIKEDEV